MAVERNDFVVGAGADTRAIRQFLRELEILPQALSRISREINKVDLGDGRKFAGKGAELSKALVQAFRSELAGGNFQASLNAALRKLDLKVPEEAKASLRRDLRKIAAEIRASLPQEVRVGVKANSNLGELATRGGASVRESAGAAAGSKSQVAKDNKAALDEARAFREEQRRARDAARQTATEQRALAQEIARAHAEAQKENVARARSARLLQGQAALDEARAFREEQRRARDAARQTATEQRALAQEIARAHAEAQKENVARARLARLLQEQAELEAQGLRLSRDQQKALQRARVQSAQATLNRTQANNSKFFNGQSVTDLVQQNTQAKQEATARTQAARNQGGPIGQVKAGLFGFGGAGSPLETLTRIAGGSAAFTASSIALQALLSGLREIVQGSFEFEESLSSLSLAFGKSTGSLRTFATEVGGVATNAGFSQATGVELASRSVGLFGTGSQNLDQQQNFARTAVQQATQVARISGGDPKAIQGDLAGLLRSFQLGNEDITRVADAVLVIARASGTQANDISTATAEIGTLANAAGFTVQQTAAIVARQATTAGQTPQAAAQQLSQFLGKAGADDVNKAFTKLGINTKGTSLAEQVAQLAANRQSGKLSAEQLNSIAPLFGRSRAGGAAVTTIRDFSQINAIADKATSSPGEGQRQFDVVTANIRQQLVRLAGSFRNFATELSQSGIFDAIAVAVPTLRILLDVLSDILQTFNQIPRPIRSAAFALAEIAIAAKLLAGVRGAAAVINSIALAGARLGTTRAAQATLGAFPTLGGAALAAKAQTSAAIRAEAQQAARAAGTGGAGALAGLANPAFLAAAAGVAVAVGAFQISRARSTADSFQSGAQAGALAAKTSAELSAAASAMRTAAEEQQKANKAFFGVGGLLDTLSGGKRSAQAGNDIVAANGLEIEALKAKAAERAAVQNGRLDASSLKDFTSLEDVKTKLQELGEAGFSATDQLDLVSKAFAQLQDAARSTASVVLKPGEGGAFTSEISSASAPAFAALQEQIALRRKGLVGGGGFNLFHGDNQGDIKDASALKKFSEQVTAVDPASFRKKINATINNQLRVFGKDPGSGKQIELSDAELASIRKGATVSASAQLEPLIKQLPEQYQQEFRKFFQAEVNIEIDKALKGSKFKGGAQPVSFQESLVKAQVDALLAEQVFGENRGDDLGAQRTRVSSLQKAIASIPQGPGLADAAQTAQVAALQRQLSDAQTSFAKAQLERTLSIRSISNAGISPNNQGAQIRAELSDLALQIAGEKDITKANGFRAQVVTKRVQLAALEVQNAATLRTASVPLGDDVKAARALVTNTADYVSFLKRTGADDAAVAAALQAKRQAQAQLAQAQLSRANNRDLLGIDLTDPVAQARSAVRDAQRRLKAATGPDDRDKAKLDLRNAQNQAEAAAFSQRLSDVQTADQLGRISHQAYLQYLKSEHDRLSSIKHRTRQQTDELNQVDLLLKGAQDQFNGQFNIGSIKLPTIYQVRRAIQQGTQGNVASFNSRAIQAGGFTQDNSTRTVILQGVPIEQVYAYIQQVLAVGARNVAVPTGRR